MKTVLLLCVLVFVLCTVVALVDGDRWADNDWAMGYDKVGSALRPKRNHNCVAAVDAGVRARPSGQGS